MSGEEKVRIAFDMSEAVRQLAMVRIAEQHPTFSRNQVRDELVWELYGVRLTH